MAVSALDDDATAGRRSRRCCQRRARWIEADASLQQLVVVVVAFALGTFAFADASCVRDRVRVVGELLWFHVCSNYYSSSSTVVLYWSNEEEREEAKVNESTLWYSTCMMWTSTTVLYEYVQYYCTCNVLCVWSAVMSAPRWRRAE